MSITMRKQKKVKVFASFEQENNYELERRRKMKTAERIQEFVVIMERTWGKDWTKQPIKKVVSFEKLT
jgi:hypothetical protein